MKLCTFVVYALLPATVLCKNIVSMTASTDSEGRLHRRFIGLPTTPAGALPLSCPVHSHGPFARAPVAPGFRESGVCDGE